MTSDQRVAIVSGWIGPEPDYVGLARLNHSRYCERHSYDYRHFSSDDIAPLIGEIPQEMAAITWIKPYVIAHLLNQGYGYVFWTDMDSLFTNFHISLEDLKEERASFVFTGDAWDLCNTGHLWFRRSSFTMEFLSAWRSWQVVSVPGLMTTHKGLSGLLADQPAMNILLHGGMRADPREAEKLFNSVNGYPANTSRLHKRFRWTHSPTMQKNLTHAQSLIHPSLQGECTVILQSRLNSYPFRLMPAKQAEPHDPIVHFPGLAKDLMGAYAHKVFGVDEGKD